VLVIECNSEDAQYFFERSGITLDYNQERGRFERFFLNMAPSREVEGDFGYKIVYRGNLPFGITRTDTISEMEAKMPGITSYVKDYRF